MSTDMLSRARAFLIKSQNSDGSWDSGDPLVCARALYALWDDVQDDAVTAGLKYLEGCQAGDGRFPAHTKMYSDASNTAYSLIVMNKFDYGKASLPVSRGILWLLENQCADGSWGSNNKKKAYTTTLCLRALHTFYLSGIARFARGLDFSLQYVEKLDLASEPVSHIYAPFLNLKRIGYLDETLERLFVDYAVGASKKAVDGGDVADAAYLLGTLKALGESEISAILEDWLVSAQADGGGFGKDLRSPPVPNWTALAVLALTGRL
jgi:hypothetical protein